MSCLCATISYISSIGCDHSNPELQDEWMRGFPGLQALIVQRVIAWLRNQASQVGRTRPGRIRQHEGVCFGCARCVVTGV